MLPIKTTTRGPAPLVAEGEDDIIDETIGYFKANVLFKHFEVKGPADRMLIYLTLYITQCLIRLEKCPTFAEGTKALTAMAHEQFKIPGEVGFALGSFFPAPANAQEGGAPPPNIHIHIDSFTVSVGEIPGAHPPPCSQLDGFACLPSRYVSQNSAEAT